MNSDFNGLIGLVLPPVIDLLNNRVTNANLRFLISLAVCAIVGIVLNLSQLEARNYDELAKSISLVFASAQVTYQLYWQKSQLRSKMRGE